MLANPRLRLFTLVGSSALMLSLDATSRSAAAGQCVDFSKDPAGCQPSTFDTPIGADAVGARQPPGQRRSDLVGSGRPGRRRRSSRRSCTCSGTSSICTGCSRCPRSRIAATGSVEGRRPRRRGRRPRPRHRRQLHLRRPRERRRRAARRSTSSRFSRIRRSSRRCRSARSRRSSRAIRASTTASCARSSTRRRRGEDRYILVRNGGTNTIGRMETYRIDMNTCLPIVEERDHRLPRRSRTSSSSGTIRRIRIACWST